MFQCQYSLFLMCRYETILDDLQNRATWKFIWKIQTGSKHKMKRQHWAITSIYHHWLTNWRKKLRILLYIFSIGVTPLSLFDNSSVWLAPFIRNSLPSCRNSINYSVRLQHLNCSSFFSPLQISTLTAELSLSPLSNRSTTPLLLNLLLHTKSYFSR